MTDGQGGPDGVRDAIDGAADVTDGPTGSGGGAPPERVARDPFDDIPVRPLGTANGVYYYLDALNQVRGVTGRDHTRMNLVDLVGGDVSPLYDWFPRTDKEDNVVGWNPNRAAETFMWACAREGVWDVTEWVRGRGAWCDRDGALVWHLGNQVVTGPAPGGHGYEVVSRPGVVGRHVYPHMPALPGPAPERAPGGTNGPARELLDLLGQWYWHRPGIDPRLMLGWLGVAMIGGALDWRPACWLTGGTGTGKTTLRKVIWGVLGAGLVTCEDPSEAGIRQTLGSSALALAIDEMEPDVNDRRGQAIVKLARMSASGAVVLRGSQDHRAQTFQVRSPFLFISINVLPLPPQDLSRLAILELERIPEGAREPSIDYDRLERLAAQLRRRLLDHWPRLGALQEAYHDVLVTKGHSHRGGAQWGTLLAVADLMLHDEAFDRDEAEALADYLEVDSAQEVGDEESDEGRCIQHLLTSTVDVYRNGDKRTVAEWIRWARGESRGDPSEAKRVLGTCGLQIVKAGGEECLAVANQHQQISRFFQETHWSARSGTQGVWIQALRRLPGARASPPVSFNGTNSRATVIPVAQLPLTPQQEDDHAADDGLDGGV